MPWIVNNKLRKLFIFLLNTRFLNLFIFSHHFPTFLDMICLNVVEVSRQVYKEEIDSDNFIVSALEDTTENGIISYDKDSVDLIVNIALSLFDSLQDYTKHINETEEKIKVKFKPKLIIEEVDTDPHFEHGELLFLEDEPESREISFEDDDSSRNEINSEDYT